MSAPVVRTLALMSTLAGLAACHRDAPLAATTFELHDAWVRATPDSGSTTAGYIRFVNGTADTVWVSHFSSDDAATVELHQSSDVAGEMHMAMLDSLAVAPNHSVTMRPGGYHLMLIGATHAFVPGSMVRIVMHLSNGAVVSTSARVKS
ncbi:MAG TPA: copper chaperone PCu(A)C [Gemmatimonadaceae bacterium]|nr:copper chaperone PCu(A)C [Gemmatimonadaceae bacterium]